METDGARPLPLEGGGVPGTHDADDLTQARHLAAVREHELRSLAELGQNLSASPDLYHLSDLALFNLMGHFGTSKAALWVRSEVPGAPLVPVRAHGLPMDIVKSVGAACSDRLPRGPGGRAQPLSVQELRFRAGEAQAPLAAGIAVLAPILGRQDTQGMVGLGPRIGGLAYGVVELQSLQAAMSVLGVAIENRVLLAQLVENNRQLRRANEDLHDLGRLKSEFMSNVNHELCTPLSVIVGYAESLLMDGSRSERERGVLGVVLDEAKKLHGMLRNLLTFSEATQGVLAMELEEGDVGPCIQRYCEERRPGASARLRELVWTIESGAPRTRFNARRLAQVVDALVDNGIKFSPEGSRIEVRVRPEVNFEGSWVAIDVADNGPGIPEDRMPMLFESFRQGDGSSTRLVGGMGIGLSFSRQLVTAMGGSIRVESESGQGAVFTVLLPEV